MPNTLCRLPIAAEERFSLADTLCCGQCFRWRAGEDGWFSGVAEGRTCRVKQEEDGLLLDCAPGDDAFWAEYFDLRTSYSTLRSQFSEDETLARAASYAPGIRVLRQYPWEALCTFIISQNNNIPRITGIVERLCQGFGEPLEGGQFAFPTPRRLATCTPEELSGVRAGFRAAYLLDAARKVAYGALDLEAVRSMPLEEARAALQTIHGVGPKVAECALLYGFGRVECFPLDVWIKRVMKTLFPGGLPECAGQYAGIAQQYLFHYARTCPEFDKT